MRIGIRTDASTLIGSGHVSRCACLAAALTSAGHSVTFVCRDLPGDLVDWINSAGFSVRRFRVDGWDPAEDAALTVQQMGDSTDLFVVDHYQLGIQWETAVRRARARIMAIDDIFREHTCDVLLDQNYGAHRSSQYRSSIDRGAVGLFGPMFALLHPDYASYRGRGPRAGRVRRAVAFFGGSDTPDWTTRVVRIFDDPRLSEIELTIVIGANHPNPTALRSRADRRPGTRCVSGLHTLAPIFADADLAIGAGGVTALERMCAGVPSVVIGMSPDQYPICEALQADDMIEYLGKSDDVSEAALTDSIHGLIRDPDRRSKMSVKGMAAVDGLGAARVAEKLV